MRNGKRQDEPALLGHLYISKYPLTIAAAIRAKHFPFHSRMTLMDSVLRAADVRSEDEL